MYIVLLYIKYALLYICAYLYCIEFRLKEKIEIKCSHK